MTAYENVIAGKLRLKGKALDVRDSDIKKKKKHKERYIPSSHGVEHDQLTGLIAHSLETHARTPTMFCFLISCFIHCPMMTAFESSICSNCLGSDYSPCLCF